VLDSYPVSSIDTTTTARGGLFYCEEYRVLLCLAALAFDLASRGDEGRTVIHFEATASRSAHGRLTAKWEHSDPGVRPAVDRIEL
jgi:hypothetical protein